MTKRRRFSDKFKVTVALEALRGDKTAQEIAAKRKVHQTQVTTWRRQAPDGLTDVFSDNARRAEDDEAEVKELHAKNGKLPFTRPNHVWFGDITYILVRRGVLFLVAIMDWATRKALSGPLSNTLDTSFVSRPCKRLSQNTGSPRL
ncbi:hypothetical protein NBRC116601_00010 [Cognatishimia sp. WU-CL00825]